MTKKPSNKYEFFSILAKENPALSVFGIVLLPSLPLAIGKDQLVVAYILIGIFSLLLLHCIYERGIKSRNEELSKRNSELMTENTALKASMNVATWKKYAEISTDSSAKKPPASTPNQTSLS